MRTATRMLGREALIFSALCSLVIFGLSLVLTSWRVQQLMTDLMTDLAQQRVLRMSQQIGLEAERGMRFGVTLPEQTTWLARLQQLQQEEPQLLALRLQDAQGAVIAQAGDLQLAGAVPAQWQRQLTGAAPPQPPVVENENARLYIGRILTDANAQASAQLWLVIDLRPTHAQARSAALHILAQIAPLLLLTLALLWAALWRLSLQWQGAARARPAAWLVLAAALACAATPLATVWSARETARPLVALQMVENADAMARTLGQQIGRALDLGIPLAQLQGVRELFEEALQQAPELGYLALRSDGAQDLHATRQRGNPMDAGAPLPSLDLRLSTATVQGVRVVVGYPTDYVDRQLARLPLDLALALLVSAVLALEFARGRWQRSSLAPLVAQRLAPLAAAVRGAALHAVAPHPVGARRPGKAQPGANPPPNPPATAQMTRLRFIIFLIALSEELLRPFLTVFALDMAPLGIALSPTMVAGLPVAAFMVTLALAQPAGPALARRIDLRWGLVLAALAGSLALWATGAAESALALVGLRAFAGMAYGLALILAEMALVRVTPTRRRARGMTQIAGAIVAAGIVGPPFGGMLAAQAGPATGFAACALCMLLAAIVSRRLDLGPRAPVPASGTGGWRGYATVVRNRRALAVIFGAALPARLVAVTLLSVVVPLQMSALQQPAAMAGRALLLYFLVFALSVSWIAQWSDASGRRTPFLVAGGLISALACGALPGLGGVPGMAIGCALLGLGQAFQSAPQLALVTEIFEPQPGVPQSATPEQALAAFRLLERLGSIAAPFVTAWAVFALGDAGAMWAIGIFLLVATLGMLPALRSTPSNAFLAPLSQTP